MSVLIVVAHPDDEVLGCGATAAALATSGRDVRSCFLSGHAEARGGRPDSLELDTDIRAAQRILGLGEPFVGRFPNIRLNVVPHIELVQFIEHAILESGATTIFTHHPSDINDDHVHVSKACQAAARLPQRRPALRTIERLMYVEIPSSTDWSFPNGGSTFQPDTFVAIDGYIERKLEALRAYRGVMRPFPHPRSEESLRALATYRGAQSGIGLAESFVTARLVGRPASVFGTCRA